MHWKSTSDLAGGTSERPRRGWIDGPTGTNWSDCDNFGGIKGDMFSTDHIDKDGPQRSLAAEQLQYVMNKRRSLWFVFAFAYSLRTVTTELQLQPDCRTHRWASLCTASGVSRGVTNANVM